VLVGRKKAVAIGVRNVSGRRRWSKLSEWLAVPARTQTAVLVQQHSRCVARPIRPLSPGPWDAARSIPSRRLHMTNETTTTNAGGNKPIA